MPPPPVASESGGPLNHPSPSQPPWPTQAFLSAVASTSAVPQRSNNRDDTMDYAMSHPVDAKTHGTAGGVSTVNPYLPARQSYNIDALEEIDDVCYLNISFSPHFSNSALNYSRNVPRRRLGR